MRVLTCAVCLVALLGSAPWARAENNQPLFDFAFSGYVQARLLGRFFQIQAPDGPLNTYPEPALAGGGKQNTISLERLEFKLSTPLPWLRWSTTASASVLGTKAVIKDAYVQYQQNAVTRWTAGRFRVPFGQELQRSSAELDTVERPLLYGFGNYGWVGPLGLDAVGERDWGAKLDFVWPTAWSNFSPFLTTALVLGNGRLVETSAPTLGMVRAGLNNRLDIDELRHELVAGLSLAYGQVRCEERREQYLPVGLAGNLLTNPQDAVATEALGQRATVATVGADLRLRVNELVLTGEWLRRRLQAFVSEGYVATAVLELSAWDWDGWEAVARWEEIRTGFADGSHDPHRPYQAATLGCNWKAWPDVRVQFNYVTIYMEGIPHRFPGSDLLLVQVQYQF
ncbi:MAG: hypothetical protein AB1439_08065 [candidate division FCPU426 bacterium]